MFSNIEETYYICPLQSRSSSISKKEDNTQQLSSVIRSTINKAINTAKLANERKISQINV